MNGHVVTAMSLASASPFLPETRSEDVAPLVRDLAAAVFGHLGWTD
jgi:DNA-binding IclR family transcriptional regulator